MRGKLRNGWEAMTDQQLALQAIREAQRILEEYLQPRPQNNECILDELVEILERPDLMVAVSRLQQRSSPECSE
jgi:chemotaxis regulatin CheY-phosphate phosphatase CheZ